MAASLSQSEVAAAPAPALSHYEASHDHRWLIAIAVILGTFLEILDTSIVNVALPHMQGSFSASVDEITWVVTSYLVANGIMIPMTGWISSRFGRKRYFLFSVTSFVIASAACGAAQSLDQIVLFRLIQGFSGAAMQPSSQAILMETFPPEEQTMAMSIWGIGVGVAPVLGPFLGGWITDNWSWRWTFYINVPVGIAAIIMVSIFLHDPPYLRRKSGGRVDYIGISLLVLGLSCLQLVLDRGQRADWFASPWVIYGTILAVLCPLLLIWRELSFPEPVLDLRVFKIPTFTLATMVMVAMGLIVYGVTLLNSLFLQEFLGYTALEAGKALGPRGLSAAGGMLLVGQFSKRTGLSAKWLLVAAVVLMVISIHDMMNWTLQVSFWQVVTPTVLNGFSVAFIFPLMSLGAMKMPRERIGYAASMFSMLRNVGAAVGIAILSTALTSRQQVHQSYLVEHFSVFDAWRMAERPAALPGGLRFLGLGEQMRGHKQGLAMLYGQIRLQAAMLSLNDIYRFLLMAWIVTMPTLLLLWSWQDRKVKPLPPGEKVIVH